MRGDNADVSEERTDEPIPLALFPRGCVYRRRAIRNLDKAHRRWRIAFGSQSLTGIQAAVSSGLGISVLPTTAVLPEHRLCTGLPELPPTELALVTSGGVLNALQRSLVDFLRAEVNAWQRARAAASGASLQTESAGRTAPASESIRVYT